MERMAANTEKRTKLSRKHASKMTTAELEELSKYFDQENVPTRPLTAKDRKDLARAARRHPGRPRRGEGAERVLVTIEGGLLRRADAYCKAKNLKRAELIAIGLQKAIRA
jgi:hypothetical protein